MVKPESSQHYMRVEREVVGILRVVTGFRSEPGE